MCRCRVAIDLVCGDERPRRPVKFQGCRGRGQTDTRSLSIAFLISLGTLACAGACQLLVPRVDASVYVNLRRERLRKKHAEKFKKTEGCGDGGLGNVFFSNR